MVRELGVDEEGWQESPWDLPYVSTGKKLSRSLFMRGHSYRHTHTHIHKQVPGHESGIRVELRSH